MIEWTRWLLHQTSVFKTNFIQVFFFLCRKWWCTEVDKKILKAFRFFLNHSFQKINACQICHLNVIWKSAWTPLFLAIIFRPIIQFHCLPSFSTTQPVKALSASSHTAFAPLCWKSRNDEKNFWKTVLYRFYCSVYLIFSLDSIQKKSRCLSHIFCYLI